MANVIQQGFLVDGQVFTTRSEAQDHIRKPLVLAALNKLTKNDKDLAQWLLDNADAIENGYDTGTIRRVTKVERNKLKKALEHVATLNDPKLAFLVEVQDSLVETFRWPTVARIKPEEKEAAIVEAFTGITNGNDNLTKWLVASREALLDAYQAGVEKRPVSEKAMAALAEHQAKRRAEKEAKLAAEAK